MLGYLDPNITVNIVKDGKVLEKEAKLPTDLRNVIKCKNPRCITSSEREIDLFRLTSPEEGFTLRLLRDGIKMIFRGESLRIMPLYLLYNLRADVA